jgi:hypothetical protein
MRRRNPNVQRAIDLGPFGLTAHLYLASAYMQPYIPGAESNENSQVAARAKEEFSQVPGLDPTNKVALASFGFALPERKEMGQCAVMVRKTDRGRSQQCGRLLQPRFHRLVEVVSGLPRGTSPRRLEAG